VTAFFRFAASGELIDWWSDDRGALAADGKTVEWMRWSTPLSEYKSFGDRRLASHGEAVWHAKAGTYSYLTVEIEEVEVNVTGAGGAQAVRATTLPQVTAAR
jgi:hypothetical protein